MLRYVFERKTAIVSNPGKRNHRGFFVVLGEQPRQALPTLFDLMVQAGAVNKSVLWTSGKKITAPPKPSKRKLEEGAGEIMDQDPVDRFMGRQINYVVYKDSEKVLGTTYGMLVMEDYEATTPNALARCIETVQGGGLLVLLLPKIKSLEELGSLEMDVHERYKTEANANIVGRFNVRLAKSLLACDSCIVLGEQLNVISTSTSKSDVVMTDETVNYTPAESEIAVIGKLAELVKTKDQRLALVSFKAVLSDTKKHTLALTAARGRGKSATLGLAVASAVSSGLSQIFITAPSPENVKTLFHFAIQGLKKLGYKEKSDYETVHSNHPAFNKAVVRINISKTHRQSVQYIAPTDAHLLGSAEIVFIDEAAAIPLPIVKKLMRPDIVFMSSTVNGYEGTGRSLSLKLIQQLREQQNVKRNDRRRLLTELQMDEPIRYSSGDGVEAWLNTLLCLDATEGPLPSSLPLASECELFHVPRESLFSFTASSEIFLQKLMALYVSSHYKNSPNDLLLLADAPAHQLYVFMSPASQEPLCVIQLSLEGNISAKTVSETLNRGARANGDLIPWLVAQQFQTPDFPVLLGARVVRIAVKEGCMGKGYGLRALELLKQYFSGKIAVPQAPAAKLNNQNELIEKLTERQPEALNYLGVSYGLTIQLHRFWKKAGYAPVYLRQTPNDLTGDYSCVMVNPLDDRTYSQLVKLCSEFRNRFLVLLSYEFQKLSVIQALSILEGTEKVCGLTAVTPSLPMTQVFSSLDISLLVAYSNNLLDYSNITHLLPSLSMYWANGQFPATLKLSAVQSAILLGTGLQRKSVDTVARELDLPGGLALSIFEKTIRSIAVTLKSMMSQES